MKEKILTTTLFSPAFDSENCEWNNNIIESCIPNILVSELVLKKEESNDVELSESSPFKIIPIDSQEVPHSISIRYLYSSEVFEKMKDKLILLEGYDSTYYDNDEVFAKIDVSACNIRCLIRLDRFLKNNYRFLDQNYYPLFFKELLKVDLIIGDPRCRYGDTYKFYQRIVEGDNIWNDLLFK